MNEKLRVAVHELSEAVHAYIASKEKFMKTMRADMDEMKKLVYPLRHM
jgi:hypothetical protein